MIHCFQDKQQNAEQAQLRNEAHTQELEEAVTKMQVWHLELRLCSPLVNETLLWPLKAAKSCIQAIVGLPRRRYIVLAKSNKYVGDSCHI